MATLEATTAHFVRCIKPNSRFAPFDVDDVMVLEQLKCNGTLEAVQLMRNGFPTRVPFAVMVERYRHSLSTGERRTVDSSRRRRRFSRWS